MEGELGESDIVCGGGDCVAGDRSADIMAFRVIKDGVEHGCGRRRAGAERQREALRAEEDMVVCCRELSQTQNLPPFRAVFVSSLSHALHPISAVLLLSSELSCFFKKLLHLNTRVYNCT